MSAREEFEKWKGDDTDVEEYEDIAFQAGRRYGYQAGLRRAAEICREGNDEMPTTDFANGIICGCNISAQAIEKEQP